jgi:hypothetical protein
MEFFKKAIRFVLFTILLLVASLIILKFAYLNNDRYEPTISINETEDLSNTEIAEKLLIMYLEHYKAKPEFDNQKIKYYKIEGVKENYAAEEGGIAFSVSYLIKQQFWNDYWDFSGYTKDDMEKHFHFVTLVKEKDQFRLEIWGLEPPTPKKQR